MSQLTNTYLFKKTIDWSLLNEGFTISVTFQNAFNSSTHQYFRRGQKRDITIIMNESIYNAKLINQPFDENKYKNHKDLLQIRYNPTSELAKDLRQTFFKSFDYLEQQRNYAKQQGRKKLIKLPDHINEQVAIYLTNDSDTYLLECMTDSEFIQLKEVLKNETEQQYEESIDYSEVKDFSAGVYEADRIIKFRKLNKAIGTSLKELYQYKCQICGKSFEVPYGSEIAEAHHIESFLISYNNDAVNQMILCPNHHWIIHKALPEFKRERLMFQYPNGFQEKLIINHHL